MQRYWQLSCVLWINITTHAAIQTIILCSLNEHHHSYSNTDNYLVFFEWTSPLIQQYRQLSCVLWITITTHTAIQIIILCSMNKHDHSYRDTYNYLAFFEWTSPLIKRCIQLPCVSWINITTHTAIQTIILCSLNKHHHSYSNTDNYVVFFVWTSPLIQRYIIHTIMLRSLNKHHHSYSNTDNYPAFYEWSWPIIHGYQEGQ